MTEYEYKTTQDEETKIENIRKSRDEFKKQVAILNSKLETQGAYIEEQRNHINKLIDAVCALSKAIKK